MSTKKGRGVRCAQTDHKASDSAGRPPQGAPDAGCMGGL